MRLTRDKGRKSASALSSATFLKSRINFFASLFDSIDKSFAEVFITIFGFTFAARFSAFAISLSSASIFPEHPKTPKDTKKAGGGAPGLPLPGISD